VYYQKVKGERDYGTEVEVTAGLNGDEALIINPPSALLEGTMVRSIAVQQQQK
jgi:hypothetical protein